MAPFDASPAPTLPTPAGTTCEPHGSGWRVWQGTHLLAGVRRDRGTGEARAEWIGREKAGAVRAVLAVMDAADRGDL